MSSSVPSAIGGVSSTIGPLVRSMHPRNRSVSALAVRNSDLASISSEKTSDLVVLHADVGKALADGVAIHALEGVHERLEGVREVEVVVDLVDVSLLGAPSLKSSVPMRVSTLSGVVSEGGVSAVMALALTRSTSRESRI